MRTRWIGRSVVVAGLLGPLLLASCSTGSSVTLRPLPTTSAPTTTTAPSASSTTGPLVPGAVVFRDPQGTYTMDVSPSWTRSGASPVKEIEAWSIGLGNATFADNVNVLTQDDRGLDLAGYLAFSKAHAGPFQVLDARIVTGPAGNQLGVMEFSTPDSATVPYRALAVASLGGGNAVVATLTASPATFDAARSETEPYLLTLQASGA